MHQNCPGCCYSSPITGHLSAQVRLSIFAMNESDSACETLGRLSWDTLLPTSDGHLVSAGLCFRADIALDPQAPVTWNLGPAQEASGHSGKHTSGVMRMTRAGRSGEGMQPLSMEQGKPERVVALREPGVPERCSPCISSWPPPPSSAQKSSEPAVGSCLDHFPQRSPPWCAPG